MSQRFELRQISDNFYQKLFKIYRKPTNHIQLRQSPKNYKMIDNKSNNKSNVKSNKSRSLPNIKQRGKNNFIYNHNF